MVRRALVGAALLSLLLVGPSSAANSTVNAVDPGNDFSPATKTINMGDRVRWANPTAGTNDHTSTSNSSNPLSWNFDLMETASGTMTRFVAFGRAGIFGYHCAVHPTSMKGSVVVRMRTTKIDSNSFTIKAATSSASSGFTHEIWMKRPGQSSFSLWRTTTAASQVFNSTAAGTYQFRSRLRKTSTNPDKLSGFSPTVSVTST